MRIKTLSPFFLLSSLVFITWAMFLFLFPSLFYAQVYPEDSPRLEPALDYTRQGMLTTQIHYTNFVIYTINVDTPGIVEIGTTNQNIDGYIEVTPFYRWRQGPMSATNNEYDVYIDSEQRGFLTVRMASSLGYTRDGRLAVDTSGRLVTRTHFYPVQGENGDIYLPEGTLTISTSGVVFVDGQRIDKLDIAVIRNRDDLISINGAFFYMDAEPQLIRGDEYYQVRQGMLEESNVLKALTGDIALASKVYEANAKASKTVIRAMSSMLSIGAP